MKTILLFLILARLIHGQSEKKITIDKKEAQKAYNFLNEVRDNPDKYAEELGYQKGLEVSNIRLRHDSILELVAEEKAFDMAKRDYVSHVDPDGFGINFHINKKGYALNPVWLKDAKFNYFESITANAANGIDAIKDFIKDSLVPSLGHRRHLLGLGEWSSSLTDIGIGFIRCDSGSLYKTYVCVIIAKHE